jgi:hypothetical protein
MSWLSNIGVLGYMIVIAAIIALMRIVVSFTSMPETIHCTRYVQSETEIIGRDCDNGVEMVVIKR